MELICANKLMQSKLCIIKNLIEEGDCNMQLFLGNIGRFFHIIVDLAYILQTVSIALSISIIFMSQKWAIKTILIELAKSLSTFLVIITTNMLLFSVPFFMPLRGVTLWGPYLMGVAFYILVYSRKNFRMQIIYSGAVIALSIIVGQIGMVIGNTLSEFFPGFSIMAIKLASDILILTFAALFRKYDLKNFEINNGHVILNLGVSLLSTVIVVLYDSFNMRNFKSAKIFFLIYSIILCCLYLINIVTYFMTRALCKEWNAVLQLRVEQQKNKAIEEMRSVSEYNYRELREIRHDLKNQYLYMQQMLVEKDYDKLQAYFEEITGTFAKPLYKYVDCGNPCVDAIMNMENAKAESHGFKTDIKVVIPTSLVFVESDLFNICVNLIDNAIESCVREECKGALIQIYMDVQGDYLRLSVKNPIKEKKVNGVTSKQDKKEHGFGLRIVKKLVKKYNGMYYFKTDEKDYLAEIYLDLKWGSNQA